MIYGFADSIVPLEQARVIEHAHLVGLPEVGHFDLVHPGTTTFAPLLEALRRLIGS